MRTRSSRILCSEARHRQGWAPACPRWRRQGGRLAVCRLDLSSSTHLLPLLESATPSSPLPHSPPSGPSHTGRIRSREDPKSPASPLQGHRLARWHPDLTHPELSVAPIQSRSDLGPLHRHCLDPLPQRSRSRSRSACNDLDPDPDLHATISILSSTRRCLTLPPSTASSLEVDPPRLHH